MKQEEIRKYIEEMLKKAEPEELDWIYIFLRTYFAAKPKKRP